MSNIHYFLDAARNERRDLARISAYSIGESITAVATKGTPVQNEQLDAICHLRFANLLEPSKLPTENDGFILVEPSGVENYRAVLVFPPFPFTSIALMPVPVGEAWNHVPEMSRFKLGELIDTRIKQLDAMIAHYESLLKKDLPDECARQRKEFDSLRQHLAECRMLSLMRNFALSRDTMEDLVSLDVHIKAELAIKATGNN